MAAAPAFPDLSKQEYSDLIVEREALRKVISKIGQVPMVELPPDASLAQGKVRQINTRISESEGYTAQMDRLTEAWPKSLEEVERRGAEEERRSEAYTEAWRIRTNAPEWDAIAYQKGQQEAIGGWVSQHSERLYTINELLQHANSQREEFEYGNAAEIISRNFARQMGRGVSEIELTQRYLCDDQQRADVEHKEAIENIRDLIQQARQQGYLVNTGNALAVGMKETQVLAVSHGMGVA